MSAPTWRSLVDDAVALGVDRHEARWMVEEATGEPGVPDTPSTAITHACFVAMVDRRLGGEPLQYVLGHWAFRRLDLHVDRRVLIPRPETEWVVEQALRRLPDGEVTVVDLGTGSGAIGLSIAVERWPSARVVATDSSPDALAVARANLAGIGRAATRVELREGSWWAAVPADLQAGIDLVVSNPPYVAPSDPLPAEVADWEPAAALVPGPTGLEAIEEILAGAAGWLRPGGWVVCEIGETQGDAARRIGADAGLCEVDVLADLTGRDRVVVARWEG